MNEPSPHSEEIEIVQIEDHPIVDVAIDLLSAGQRPDLGMVLTPEAAESLREILGSLVGSTELMLAVDALTRLAKSLDDSGSPYAAASLLGLVDEDAVINALAEIVSFARELALSEADPMTLGEGFGRFSGKSSLRALPAREHESRPEGALSIDALSFPRRI